MICIYIYIYIHICTYLSIQKHTYIRRGVLGKIPVLRGAIRSGASALRAEALELHAIRCLRLCRIIKLKRQVELNR